MASSTLPYPTGTVILAHQDDGPWQEQLRSVITDPAQLLTLLQLEAHQVGLSEQACKDFPLRVTRSFLRRMQPGDPGDPLLLQVLANERELVMQPGFSADPVGENGTSNPRPGIIHKYRGRLLLIVTGGCAINCRYCFRRHFPYNENQNSRLQWRDALQYIRSDNSIEEVILSGGDPLVATDAQLGELVQMIADIAHVKRLRIHSRLPIVLPDRVTSELIEAITHPALQTIMVAHCNHANEIDNTVSDAVSRLQDAGITILNQAVLLAKINDSSEAQVALNKALFGAGILPYYLHLMDRVQGAAHFEVPQQTALAIMSQVSAELPGYMVPRLVREEHGAPAKTLLQTSQA